MSEELRKGVPKAEVIEITEFSEEEKERYDRDFEKILKEFGVLKKDESIKNLKRPE